MGLPRGGLLRGVWGAGELARENWLPPKRHRREGRKCAVDPEDVVSSPERPNRVLLKMARGEGAALAASRAYMKARLES